MVKNLIIPFISETQTTKICQSETEHKFRVDLCDQTNKSIQYYEENQGVRVRTGARFLLVKDSERVEWSGVKLRIIWD